MSDIPTDDDVTPADETETLEPLGSDDDTRGEDGEGERSEGTSDGEGASDHDDGETPAQSSPTEIRDGLEGLSRTDGTSHARARWMDALGLDESDVLDETGRHGRAARERDLARETLRQFAFDTPEAHHQVVTHSLETLEDVLAYREALHVYARRTSLWFKSSQREPAALTRASLRIESLLDALLATDAILPQDVGRFCKPVGLHLSSDGETHGAWWTNLDDAFASPEATDHESELMNGATATAADASHQRRRASLVAVIKRVALRLLWVTFATCLEETVRVVRPPPSTPVISPPSATTGAEGTYDDLVHRLQWSWTMIDVESVSRGEPIWTPESERSWGQVARLTTVVLTSALRVVVRSAPAPSRLTVWLYAHLRMHMIAEVATFDRRVWRLSSSTSQIGPPLAQLNTYDEEGKAHMRRSAAPRERDRRRVEFVSDVLRDRQDDAEWIRRERSIAETARRLLEQTLSPSPNARSASASSSSSRPAPLSAWRLPECCELRTLQAESSELELLSLLAPALAMSFCKLDRAFDFRPWINAAPLSPDMKSRSEAPPLRYLSESLPPTETKTAAAGLAAGRATSLAPCSIAKILGDAIDCFFRDACTRYALEAARLELDIFRRIYAFAFTPADAARLSEAIPLLAVSSRLTDARAQRAFVLDSTKRVRQLQRLPPPLVSGANPNAPRGSWTWAVIRAHFRELCDVANPVRWSARAARATLLLSESGTGITGITVTSIATNASLLLRCALELDPLLQRYEDLPSAYDLFVRSPLAVSLELIERVQSNYEYSDLVFGRVALSLYARDTPREIESRFQAAFVNMRHATKGEFVVNPDGLHDIIGEILRVDPRHAQRTLRIYRAIREWVVSHYLSPTARPSPLEDRLDLLRENVSARLLLIAHRRPMQLTLSSEGCFDPFVARFPATTAAAENHALAQRAVAKRHCPSSPVTADSLHWVDGDGTASPADAAPPLAEQKTMTRGDLVATLWTDIRALSMIRLESAEIEERARRVDWRDESAPDEYDRAIVSRHLRALTFAVLAAQTTPTTPNWIRTDCIAPERADLLATDPVRRDRALMRILLRVVDRCEQDVFLWDTLVRLLQASLPTNRAAEIDDVVRFVFSLALAAQLPAETPASTLWSIWMSEEFGARFGLSIARWRGLYEGYASICASARVVYSWMAAPARARPLCSRPTGTSSAATFAGFWRQCSLLGAVHPPLVIGGAQDRRLKQTWTISVRRLSQERPPFPASPPSDFAGALIHEFSRHRVSFSAFLAGCDYPPEASDSTSLVSLLPSATASASRPDDRLNALFRVPGGERYLSTATNLHLPRLHKKRVRFASFQTRFGRAFLSEDDVQRKQKDTPPRGGTAATATAALPARMPAPTPSSP